MHKVFYSFWQARAQTPARSDPQEPAGCKASQALHTPAPSAKRKAPRILGRVRGMVQSPTEPPLGQAWHPLGRRREADGDPLPSAARRQELLCESSTSQPPAHRGEQGTHRLSTSPQKNNNRPRKKTRNSLGSNPGKRRSTGWEKPWQDALSANSTPTHQQRLGRGSTQRKPPTSTLCL